MVAAALVAALPEAAYLSDAAGLRSVLAGLRSEGVVRVHEVGPLTAAAYDQFRADAHRNAAQYLHGYLAVRAVEVQSRLLDISSHNGVPAGARRQDVIQFVTHEDITAHVELVSGGWPAPAGASGPIAVTLSEAAARQLPAAVGDRVCVNDGAKDDAFCAVVSGIWRQRDAGSAFWAADASLPLEAEVSEDDLFRRVVSPQIGYDAVAVLTPDLTAIDRGDPAEAADTLAGLGPSLGGNRAGWHVETQLDAALGDYRDRQRVASFALQIVTAQLWLLALGCVLFLVALRLDQERLTIAVWRTRGWSRRQAGALLAIELAVLAVLALPFGVAAGVAVAAWLVGRAYLGPPLPVLNGLSASAPILALAWAGLLALVAGQALLAARAGVLRARATASRPALPWWRRGRVALFATAVAVAVLAEARMLGSARLRTAGADQPYYLVLPGVGIALVAFAGVRLLPWLARVTAGAARGVEERLAGLQVRRASAHQEALALLLTGTVALGIFAAAYAGTAAQNASDRAAYAAGADLRATAGGSKPVDLEALDVPGAQAVTSVYRGYARPGSAPTEVSVLGVKPSNFASVAWDRPGLGSAPLPDLMRQLASAEKGGTVLPAGASGLSLWVHGQHTGGSLEADLTDAGDQPVRARFGTLDFDGWRQLKATFAPSKYRAPLRLRRLTFSPVTTPGTVAVARLAASDATAVEAAMIEPFSTLLSGAAAFRPGSWSVTDGVQGALLGPLLPDSNTPLNGAATAHVFLRPDYVPVSLYPSDFTLATPSPGFQRLVSNPIPALVSSSILAANRLRIGQPLSVVIDSTPVNTVVVGTIDFFPTLYGPGIVVGLEALQEVLTVRGNQRPWPSELWARVAPGQAGAAAQALAANPAVADVVSGDELRQLHESDPLVLAGRVNLGLGFAAALLLALAAFAIHFVLVGRARATDYAILQANGMSARQVRRSLAVEQLLLLVLSGALGLVLGAVLAAVLLPSLEVSATPQDTVPPTVLAVDLRLALAAIAAVLAGGLVVGRLAARATPTGHVMTELRSLG